MNRPILLIRGRDNQPVNAILCEATQKHKDDFKAAWKSQLQTFGTRDREWDWEFKARVYSSLPGAELYAVECERDTQGLMLITKRGKRSWLAPNQPIVYVRYIASAPWNRLEVQDPPTYKTVGSVMLKFARFRSTELGYGGFVGLHSLPGAEGFYRKQGMIELGTDPTQENLVYFEWYRSREG